MDRPSRRPAWRRAARAGAAVAALLLGASVLAGCSGGGDDSAAPSTTTASTTVPGRSTCPNFRGSTTSLSSQGAVAQGFLVDVTAQGLDCLDKVTFVFEPTSGLPPGYTVGYQDVGTTPLTDCGEPITLPGNAFLVVKIQPAASNDPARPEGDQQTYRGNLRLSYEGEHHLQIVQKTCDGDGTVNWIIGLDAVRPFVVDRAQEPSRISVLIG